MSVIGVDLDGTLAKFDTWTGGEQVGSPDEAMVSLIRTLHLLKHTICIWTTRPEYVVKTWLRQHNLMEYVHFINSSPNPSESGKESFDYYIGDDAIRWEGIPADVLNIIEQRPPMEREVDFSSHNPRPYLSGVGRAYVDMFEEHWLAAWEKHQFGRQNAFLTICSHAKPYSKSFIHSTIRKKLWDLHELRETDYIHISNAGIVPATVEMEYPFNAYDWNGELCSEEVRDYHIAAIKRRFRKWLTDYGDAYDRVIVYLREGGNTFNAVSEVLSTWTRYPVKLVPAEDDHSCYSFVQTPDVDDCLTFDSNLTRLAAAFKLPRG